MKSKLNRIYHQFFPEIMTGILASLLIITCLLIFGIYNGTVQRNQMQKSQNVLIQNDSVVKAKQDSTLKRSRELMDLIKSNGRFKK